MARVAREGLLGLGPAIFLLAGAAALYYLYKKHQNAPAQTGPASPILVFDVCSDPRWDGWPAVTRWTANGVPGRALPAGHRAAT